MNMSKKPQFGPARPKRKSPAGRFGLFSRKTCQRQVSGLTIFSRFFGHTAIAFLLGLTLPFCASADWREGFVNDDTAYLVGEGTSSPTASKLQSEAMAKEAAIMVAMSHWPKVCPGKAVAAGMEGSSEDTGNPETLKFRVENTSMRRVECEGSHCRARIVIEKKNLRRSCAG